MLPERLTWIDETNREQHHFLEVGDRCLFFGDFHSGKGCSGGATNQLIKNYKRTAGEIAGSGNSRELLYYKEKAIAEVAAAADIRVFLRQTRSTEVDHVSGRNRLKFEELLGITEVDCGQLATQLRREVVLFDDVLTSGKHFKVAQRRVLELAPGGYDSWDIVAVDSCAEWANCYLVPLSAAIPP